MGLTSRSQIKIMPDSCYFNDCGTDSFLITRLDSTKHPRRMVYTSNLTCVIMLTSSGAVKMAWKTYTYFRDDKKDYFLGERIFAHKSFFTLFQHHFISIIL